ncbi:cytochrome P450 monooxygenase [Penicillium angulare]|uniref:Cytochrome P450 monooxygenase n=1 Tax=Penicillium angulare TaxID=116970 RepID=A0A9W9G9M5_9EURO|nr:cytochrome P450 monooxygenase [Penicillium angulare]
MGSANMTVLYPISLPAVVGVLSQSNWNYALAIAPLIGLTIVICDYVDGWSRRKAFTSKGITIVDEGSNLSPVLRWMNASTDLVKANANAYKQYIKNGKPYAMRMHHGDHVVVLPGSSAKEWRNLPREHHSFYEAVSVITGQEHYMANMNTTSADTLNACNNKSTMNKFHELLLSEIDRHLPLTYDPPSGQDWHEINTLPANLEVFSKIATSLIYGPEFTSNPIFMDHFRLWAATIMPTLYVQTNYPRILRPLIWHFHPVCRTLRSSLNGMKEILLPGILNRIHRVQTNKRSSAVDENGRFSLLDYHIDAALKDGSLDRYEGGPEAKSQVIRLMDNSIQSLFQIEYPEAINVTYMMYAIMEHPEYLEPLREEILTALKLCNNEWTPEILNHCPKLESFNREAFRMRDEYTINIYQMLVINMRTFLKPFTSKSLKLSLSPGTMTMTPCRAVHLDSDNYPDPTTFNGLRFYDEANGTCSPRITTTSPTFLTFSHGTGSCPARALVAQMTRLTFIKFLLSYDMELIKETMPAEYGIPHPLVYFPTPDVRMRVRARKG